MSAQEDHYVVLYSCNYMLLGKSQLGSKPPMIGKLVRALLQELPLSQEKFAAEIGVTFTTTNRWENGRVTPSPLARQRLDFLLNQLGERGEVLHSRCWLQLAETVRWHQAQPPRN